MRFFLSQIGAMILIPGLVGPVAAQASAVGLVENVSIVSAEPFQLQIKTSRPASPEVQLISNPERLVIDIPNSIPGNSLHSQVLNRGDVLRVRFSLYSTRPAITRLVVDLKAPEWYRVLPNSAGIMVALGGDRGGESPANSEPAIGWVSARGKTVQAAPVVLKQAAMTHAQPVNGASVVYANGQLTIHANNATLSEVLFQIQQRTGAEIAIPSGTEQDRVAADFGPGPPSEVLPQLLNGTGLNFVLVGSASDPNQLGSVILSRKTGEADPPSAFESADTSAPPATSEAPPPNYEPAAPPPESGPEQGPPPPNAPPPDVPN
jgi:AMIN domain